MNETSPQNEKKIKLTPALIAKFYTEKPLQDLQEAKFTNLQIDEIEDISMCISLVKLDLGENALENASSLTGLRYMKGLRVLNLGKNYLSNVDLLKNLDRLCVLNLSHNKFKEVPMFLSKFKNLKAIILNGNQLSMLPLDLVFPNSISTIVLSDNLLQEMGYFGGGKNFPSLSKLSLAHNEIRAIPPNLHQQMPMLKELRLAGNKIISLPELALPHSLEILDLSSNLIGDLGNLLTGVKHLSHLKSLCLKGCPIAKDTAILKDSLRKTLGSLRILDGERFDEEWFIKRKLSAIPKFKSKIHKSSTNHAASAHHHHQ